MDIAFPLGEADNSRFWRLRLNFTGRLVVLYAAMAFFIFYFLRGARFTRGFFITLPHHTAINNS